MMENISKMTRKVLVLKLRPKQGIIGPGYFEKNI
jgi:hypothetical protein